PIPVRHLEVGLNVLEDWYRSIQSPILVTDEIKVDVDGWFAESGDGWRAVCASVPATWLTDLHARHKDKLFSANVRGYMPSRRTAQNINYGMEQTARQTPRRFWAFNNGVTALVLRFEPPATGARTLTINGIAIVNGAQTTGALSRSAGTGLKGASVMIRFVQC